MTDTVAMATSGSAVGNMIIRGWSIWHITGTRICSKCWKVRPVSGNPQSFCAANMRHGWQRTLCCNQGWPQLTIANILDEPISMTEGIHTHQSATLKIMRRITGRFSWYNRYHDESIICGNGSILISSSDPFLKPLCLKMPCGQRVNISVTVLTWSTDSPYVKVWRSNGIQRDYPTSSVPSINHLLQGLL